MPPVYIYVFSTVRSEETDKIRKFVVINPYFTNIIFPPHYFNNQRLMNSLRSAFGRLSLLLIAITCSMALSSCVNDDDDFLFNDLQGQWGIASPVTGLIEFYGDGTGSIAYTDDLGEQFYEDFNWWTDNPVVTIQNWDCDYFPTGDYSVYWGPNAVTLTPLGGGVPIVLVP